MSEPIIIGGHPYTVAQLESATNAAWLLALAYAKADDANGGGSSVDWDDLNTAHHAAAQVWDRKATEELNQEARFVNGVEPALAVADSEGGEPD
jgi:hypothetical protein